MNVKSQSELDIVGRETCVIKNHNHIQVLVVAGGMTGDGLTASTEILEDGEWREVGELTVPMADLRGVTLQDTVIMTGMTLFSKVRQATLNDILSYNANTAQHAVSPIEAGYVDMCLFINRRDFI